METRELPNLSRYLISEDGEVKVKSLTLPHYSGGVRITKSKWLKGQIDHKGYKVYHLIQDDGIKKVYKAHRLVCMAWYENKENKQTVNHKDGNKLNNHYTNLEWATQKENVRHSYETGLNGLHCLNEASIEGRRIGGINSMKKKRKLTIKDAENIRKRIKNGEKQKDLAIEYCVSSSTINEIWKNKRYIQ